MPSRFARFSEEARRVLSFSQEEAQRLHHNYIGTEHLLLGLLRDPEGSAYKVLADLKVEPEELRSAIEATISRGDRPSPGGIGLTAESKKAIELTVQQTRELGLHYVGTDHLLIALLLAETGIAATVLKSFGVTEEKVKAAATAFPEESAKVPRPLMPDAEWPDALKQLAADLKRTQMMQEDAVSQKAYELAADYSQEVAELNRRFEEWFARWVQSQPE